MERRVIDGYHEEILASLDHFCGIYGALSSGRLASDRQYVVSCQPLVFLLYGKQTARK